MIPTALYDAYTTALTENDREARAALAAIIAQLDPADVDGIRDALLEAYPALVRLYGTRAAQVALEFYTGVRQAQEVSTPFSAYLPTDEFEEVDQEAVADVRREVGGLYSGSSTLEAFTSTMQQLASKRSMGMADTTLMQLAAADPAHPKVALVPHMGACGWCVMLGSRGFTNTEKAMGNMRHDGCKCTTVTDFNRDNPALKGYDPDAMYQLYREACTDEDMRQWRAEWNAMSAEERAKYVRRTRDRTGAVKEHPGDWSTYVRNRTAQNMGKLMRDPGFKGGHEELAAWLPKQRKAMNIEVSKDIRIEQRIRNAQTLSSELYDLTPGQIKKQAEEWQTELSDAWNSVPNINKDASAYRRVYASVIEAKSTNAPITVDDFTKVRGKELQIASWFSSIGESVHLRNPNLYKDLPEGNTSDAEIFGILFDFKRVESPNPKQLRQRITKKLDTQGPGFVSDLSISEMPLDAALKACAELLDRERIDQIIIIKDRKAIVIAE